MPTEPQESYSILTSPSQPRSVFGTKIPSTVTFAIGLFLFILPFAELKCKMADQKQTPLINLDRFNFAFTNTGLGLALGNDWKLNIPIGNIFQNEQTDSWKKSIKSQKPNTYAIVALVMAVLGLGLSFVNTTRVAVITTVAGAISAGALIGLMIDLKKRSKDIISEFQNAGDNINIDNSANLSLSFTPWLYIAIIAMLAGAIFSYKRILEATRRT